MFKVVDKNNIKDFKNFTMNELKCGCKGKYCNGFPVDFSYELLEQLQKIRNHFGKPVIITSAIRCQKYNDSLKGSIKKSKHTMGRAVDFYVKGVSYKKLWEYVKTLPHNNYTYNISGSVMHHDITPNELYNLKRILKKGCTGDDVKELQKCLKIKADGIFGSNTKKSVIALQKQNKLFPYDGIVGKKTAHALGWLYKGC
jgi:peptidoglycan hydrolase-like protein with peptidoglycan-binding domain